MGKPVIDTHRGDSVFRRDRAGKVLAYRGGAAGDAAGANSSNARTSGRGRGRKLELFREWQGMKESDTEEVLKALTAKDEYPQDSEEVVAPLKTMAQKLEDGDSHFVREEEDPVHYSLEELRADGHIPLDVMGQEVLVGDYIRYYRDKLPPHKRDSSCYYKVVDLIPIEQKAQGGAGKNGRKLAAEHEDQRRSFMRGETYFTWELVTDKGRIPFDRMAWLRVDPDEVLNAPKADEGVPVGSTSTDQEELTLSGRTARQQKAAARIREEFENGTPRNMQKERTQGFHELAERVKADQTLKGNWG